MSRVGSRGAGAARIGVLVVDDEPEIADLVATYLERTERGLATTAATSPTAALDELTERRYDCVISDYHMPGMDGLALLERVAERAPDATRVLHTGADDDAVVRRAREAGVDYVHKRVDGRGYDRLATLVLRDGDG